MVKRVIHKKSSHEKNKTFHPLVYLFCLLLLLLASLTVLQQPQEIRKFAEETTPTPTEEQVNPTSTPSLTPTLTITPTNTSSITPTPFLRCNVPCTYTSQCPTGLFCSAGACRQPSCPAEETCVCKITPTPGAITPTTVASLTPTKSPTVAPTKVPTVTAMVTPTDTMNLTPTIELTVSPTPAFEVSKDPERKVSLLEAVVQFISTGICKLFRLC